MSRVFDKLVEQGNPVGEIIGIDSFMVKVKGLQPTNVRALVRFDDDTRGYVHYIYEDFVVVMKMDPSPLKVGAVCVIEDKRLVTKVGKEYIGRVINAFGEPFLDTAGAPTNNKNMVLTFGVTVGSGTPAGSYSADIGLIAVGKF